MNSFGKDIGVVFVAYYPLDNFVDKVKSVKTWAATVIIVDNTPEPHSTAISKYIGIIQISNYTFYAICKLNLT